ncbi:MAG: aminoacyl--tRNA ligase-related protein [Candidatus Peribacteraceae bacterium]|jgi:prolyl-tRNA synthetase
MLLSRLFAKTSKTSVADADSRNAELLVRAGFVAKTMAGVYSFLPLGLRVLRNIETVVREEMEGIGGQEVLLSALSPREYWEKTGRWDRKVFDVLFRVPAAGEQEYGLNPTHEEIITPIVKQFVHSYRDLPFAAYQIQTKFRNELRAKSGLLRGREFLMKDLYSFHADQGDLEKYYATVQGAYDRVFERIGLGEKTYLTYAAGGTFSKYSHEYQVLLENGEDGIFVSVEAERQGKRIAVNKEIYEPGKTVCPVTGGKEFREAKASEAANIFMLGTKFSLPFGLTYNAKDGTMKEVVMGCYGIGISRLMGIIAEAFADEQGLVWPVAVAPARAHIIPIVKTTEEEAYGAAVTLRETLEREGISTLFDDRVDLSAGSRMADADLMGLPCRIVVSPKTLKAQGAELKDRRTGTVTLVPLTDVLGNLRAVSA